MKNTKLLLIISLLLCLAIFLIGCEGKKQDDPDTDTDTDTEVVIDAAVNASGTRENFIGMEYEEDEGLNVVQLTSQFGELLDENSTENLLVFLKETKDYMNNLTQTYTIWSTQDLAVVKTFTHTYADHDYDIPDDFYNKHLPEKEMYVEADTVIGEVDFIKVTYVTNAPIGEEIIEDNKLDDSYVSDFTYEFYDAKGTLITSTKMASTYSAISPGLSTVSATFGGVVAQFDVEENKLIGTFDGEKNPPKFSFSSYENEKYVYFLDLPFGGVDYGSPLGYSGTLEVYSKASGELVCSYEHSDLTTATIVDVLENGDIIIQNLYNTEVIDFDFFVEDVKVDYQTFILDVETGKVTEVDFEYILLGGIYNADEFIEECENKDWGKVTLTGNVRNIAYGVKIVDGTVSEHALDLIFFDNTLAVNYKFEKYCDEQTHSENVKVLPDGYVQVEVNTPFASYAIVKDGKIVTYVPQGAIVTDYAFITSEGDMYDYNMNFIVSISDSEHEFYSYVDSFGKYVFYHAEEEVFIYDETQDSSSMDAPESYKIEKLYVYDTQSGTRVSYEDTFIDDITEDYVIFCSKNAEGEVKYTLYDKNMQKCIESDDYINIDQYNDCYIVKLWANGKEYVFVLAPSTEYINMEGDQA